MRVLSSEAEDLLRRLVLLKSSESDDVSPMVEFVVGRLRGLGLEPNLLGDADKPTIFAEHGKDGVVLSGHLDTVPLGEGWTKKQGEVVDGMMYGRGAADMKGGCSAILLAAEVLAEEGTPFGICLTLDEEISMNGALAVAHAGLLKKAPAVLIAEPSDFDIVVREKGLVQFAVRTAGRSAHAGMPELGDNAITKMTSLLHRMRGLQKTPKDPLKECTMCVTKIAGGTQLNVIPDSCKAEIDSRFPPDMTSEEVLEIVRRTLDPLEYEMRTLHQLEPVETDANLPAVKILHEIVGTGAKILGVPYATEMVMFKRDNSTLMVCGPGEPAQAHALDECIEIDGVVRAAKIYQDYCRRMTDDE
ncbi:MAG: M20/M25/M40 family metallo-hydrolase [Methanobacteriota archaeon]|nr:MAG: M20/M25/M40 family metallo-hydrolase [Euryarchaeota archaeon]